MRVIFFVAAIFIVGSIHTVKVNWIFVLTPNSINLIIISFEKIKIFFIILFHFEQGQHFFNSFPNFPSFGSFSSIFTKSLHDSIKSPFRSYSGSSSYSNNKPAEDTRTNRFDDNFGNNAENGDRDIGFNEKMPNNDETQNNGSFDVELTANEQYSNSNVNSANTDYFYITNSESLVTIHKNGEKYQSLEGPYEYNLTEFTKPHCNYQISLSESFISTIFFNFFYSNHMISSFEYELGFDHPVVLRLDKSADNNRRFGFGRMGFGFPFFN